MACRGHLQDGSVTLRLITSPDLEPIEWVERDFQPYYLTTQKQGEPVKKIDLFTGNELTLYKVNLHRETSEGHGRLGSWILIRRSATCMIRDFGSASFTVSAATVGFRMLR